MLAICSITAVSIKWYDKTNWVYGEGGGKCLLPDPSDEFNHYYCLMGQWTGLPIIPFEKFNERTQACTLGKKITGCINGKYFHHLSKECLKNPKGLFCDETTSYETPFKDLKVDDDS